MKPIGLLMIEHRLIERMIALLEAELGSMAATGKVDDHFLDDVIDFFRKYADLCHHGKEEDIFFKQLDEKPLSAEHKAMMDGLIEDHVFARNTVERLVAAKESYLAGGGSRADIAHCIATLTRFYPEHIEKEDRHFFFPSLQYLSADEQTSMLAGFREFDAKLMHGIYERIIKAREDRGKNLS